MAGSPLSIANPSCLRDQSGECIVNDTTTSIENTFLNTQPEPTTATASPSGNGGGERGAGTTTVVSATTPATHSAAPTATMTAVPSSDAAKTIGSSTGSKGMSNGAVAGIAIGMLIIGAALAFLAAFLLFKRRKRPSSHPYGESTPELVSPLKGKGTPYVEVSQNAVPAPVLSTPVAPTKRGLDLTNLANSSDFLAAVLPPAADEQMVKNKIVTLFNEISHHVDSYYRDVHATTTPTMESDLAKFGSGSINLLEMLQNSSMPTVAIKHALATYILSIVSPEAEDQATLFPTEISGLKENERSTQRPDDQAAYILYKRLAVHLHSPTAASLQSRQSDIREAAEHFALTFFPWANPAYNDQEKDEDLVQTINNALSLSIWLYGQPFLYDYVWEGVGRRGTVVAPGLVKVTDNVGRLLERPHMLLEPVVVSA